jgi:hypothetical protein
MKKVNILVLLLLSLVVSACKIQIDVPAGGHVESLSGAYSCAAGKRCDIDVVDLFFDEEFVATPEASYLFTGWVKKDRGFCGGKQESCHLYTSLFEGHDLLMAFLQDPNLVFFLTPGFESSKFSLKELSGETLYSVAFVGGGDDDEDFAEVVEITFSENGKVTYRVLTPGNESGETTFDVTEDGLLYFGGDASAVNGICGITDDYLKGYRNEEGEFDNTELWFFDEQTALKYASTLTEEVPQCQ